MVKVLKYAFDWLSIHKEYLNGKTLNNLDSELGRNYQCVSQKFKKLGLKVMTLSEANIRSRKISRNSNGRTRSTMRYKGKRIQISHYNWCVANNFPYIPKGFVIHHIDNNRHNNNAKNLVLLPSEVHKSLHYYKDLLNDPNRIYWGKNETRGK